LCRVCRVQTMRCRPCEHDTNALLTAAHNVPTTKAEETIRYLALLYLS
jgi:hypothetical protein